jgi:hypothetical protein
LIFGASGTSALVSFVIEVTISNERENGARLT